MAGGAAKSRCAPGTGTIDEPAIEDGVLAIGKFSIIAHTW